jgi:plasmid stabilization system protein ParE
MNYLIHPAAEREADEAANWYEREDLSLALEFARVYRMLIDEIILHPRRYPAAEDAPEGYDCRNVSRIGRFPYRIVYALVGDDIYVVAVAHHFRKPGYWESRLRQAP